MNDKKRQKSKQIRAESSTSSENSDNSFDESTIKYWSNRKKDYDNKNNKGKPIFMESKKVHYFKPKMVIDRTKTNDTTAKKQTTIEDSVSNYDTKRTFVDVVVKDGKKVPHQ